MWDTAERAFVADAGGAWHWGHADWGWMMGLHGLFWLVVLAVIVALLVLTYRAATNAGDGSSRPSTLDILEARYARGEIGREEFLDRKRDLSKA